MGSDTVKVFFSGSPAKVDRLKIFTLIQKADSQFESERVNLCK